VTFIFNMGIGWIIHSIMISGLRLQHEGVEFEMDMISGKYWGEYDAARQCDEFTDEKSSKSFFSQKLSQEKLDELYDEELYRESDYSKGKSERKSKVKNQCKRSPLEKRCIQRARKHLKVNDQTHYTTSVVLTLPDSHYERLTANTPLYVAYGDNKVIRPIPTPTRSRILSITRTIFTLPLLLFGIIPETNEIEISLWGGDSDPLFIQDRNDDFELIIESCALQILDCSIIVTPHLSTFERFLTRFPFFSILLLATILQSGTMIFWSTVLIYFFRPQLISSIFHPSSNIEEIPINTSDEDDDQQQEPIKLRRSVDSWSELQESD